MLDARAPGRRAHPDALPPRGARAVGRLPAVRRRRHPAGVGRLVQAGRLVHVPVEDGLIVLTDSESREAHAQGRARPAARPLPGDAADPGAGRRARHRQDLLPGRTPSRPTASSAGCAPGSATTSASRRSRRSTAASASEVAPPFHQAPPDCIGCLACAEICPTSCIPYETSDTRRVIWEKYVRDGALPAVRPGPHHAGAGAHYAGRSGVPAALLRHLRRVQAAADGGDLHEAPGGAGRCAMRAADSRQPTADSLKLAVSAQGRVREEL